VQVSISFGVVQAVTHDKFVQDAEAYLVRRHGNLPAFWLVQKHRHLQAYLSALPEIGNVD
jgi:hypothetical protein